MPKLKMMALTSKGRRLVSWDISCRLRLHRAQTGFFTEWHWDGQKLVLENDKYGFFPIYMHQTSSEIAVSNDIMQLLSLGISRELDYAALAVFARLGYFLGEETAFTHIKALPAHTKLTWEKGAVNINTEPYQVQAIKIKRDKAIEQFNILFKRAIKKRLPPDNRFVVPLSGGRDSRHILLELLEHNVTPEFCITHHQYPTTSDDDVRIAQVLTQQLGLKHVIVDQPSSRFGTELRKNYITNFCSDEHAQMLVLADYLDGKTDVMFDGVAGMLSESYLLNHRHAELYQEGRYSDLTVELIKYWSVGDEILKLIFHKDFYQKINLELARNHLINEIKRHANAPNPIASFHFWNRCRREISLIPYNILAGIPFVYSPYLDHDVVDFLMSLPFDVLADGKFNTDAIAMAYPQIAKIPYENKKTKETGREGHQALYSKEFAKYFLKKLKWRSNIVNSAYLFPRAARCVVDEKYCLSFSWATFSPLVYFMHLEEIVAGRSQV